MVVFIKCICMRLEIYIFVGSANECGVWAWKRKIFLKSEKDKYGQILAGLFEGFEKNEFRLCLKSNHKSGQFLAGLPAGLLEPFGKKIEFCYCLESGQESGQKSGQKPAGLWHGTGSHQLWPPVFLPFYPVLGPKYLHFAPCLAVHRERRKKSTSFF